MAFSMFLGGILDRFDPLGCRNHKSDIQVDNLYQKAVDVVFETRQASGSLLQRKLSISWENANRLLSKMEQDGIIGPFRGNAPREILMSIDEFTRTLKIGLCSTSEIEKNIDLGRIIEEEAEWRKQQRGLSQIESVLEKIDNMEGHQFEYWCADLLRKLGYINVTVTQGSGDQGVDILAEKDGIKYAVQCKCYSADIGNKPVQEVNTGKIIYHCQIGVVITNRRFTQGGKEAATATGVLLWDRDWIQTKIEELEA